MNEDYCAAGIDGGGSKTECAIVNSRGECLGIGLGGSSNMNYADLESVRESINTACRLADEAAGPDRAPIRAIGCAMLRVRSSGQPQGPAHSRVAKIEEDILARFGGEVHYVAEGEVALGCIDVFDRVGVSCIAGTGSSVFGYGLDGRRIVRGGWGSPLGDEGGAYDIAIQGLRAAGKAFEGRGPATLLIELAEEFFSEEFDSWFLRRLGPKAANMRPEIAQFARMVARAADAGDDAALRILESAADDLAGLTLCTAKALFQPDAEFPIALHGGVLSNKIVAERVRGIILREFPKARAVQPFHSPGVGAALVTLYDIKNGIAPAYRYE